MRVLGIDFETQGVDAETTNITEVGECWYYPKTNGRGTPASHFVYDETYPSQTPDVVELTGITDEILKKEGKSPREVMLQVIAKMAIADYVIAYNKAFDQVVFNSYCARLNLTVPSTPWLCAMTEVPYPEKFTCAKLSHRAYDHGILVDPATLHRASEDVELMFKILDKYSFDDILKFAKEPWIYLKASIPQPWTDAGVGRAKAKARKFSWEKANGDDKTFPKTWVKRVKLGKLDNELAQAQKLGLLVFTIEDRKNV